MWTPEPSVIVTADMRVDDERDQLIEQFRCAIQAHVDQIAQSRRYDSGVSLASYVVSSIPEWAEEAQAFVAWRDAVWAYAYAELNKVLTGERDVPSVAGIIEELPVVGWLEDEHE